MRLYQLYDIEAQSPIGPIITEKRDAPAIRMFHDILNNKDTLPGKYPQHFELRHLADQDDETSALTAFIPRAIATGAAWLETQNPDKLTLTA